MAYSPQVWNNGPNSGTPINALRLNKMEGGIRDAALVADNANAGVAGANSALDDFKATVGTASGPASNQAPCAIFRSTANLDLPRNTWVMAQWDTRVVDLPTTHYNSATPTRWICRRKGVYFFNGAVFINAWQNNSTYTALRKNGVEQSETWRAMTAPGPPAVMQTTAMFSLEVGDYIELGGYHDATTDATGYRKLYGAMLYAFLVRAL